MTGKVDTLPSARSMASRAKQGVCVTYFGLLWPSINCEQWSTSFCNTIGNGAGGLCLAVCGVEGTEKDMISSCYRHCGPTHDRHDPTMDKEEELLQILGKLRGGSLEEVADKLLAFFFANPNGGKRHLMSNSSRADHEERLRIQK